MKTIISFEDGSTNPTDKSVTEAIEGKVIERIRLDSTRMMIEFEDSVLQMRVEGDCCSYSYFHDFFGLDRIIGKKIDHIEEIALDPTDLKVRKDGEGDSYIEVYGYKIVCEPSKEDDEWDRSANAVFSFRNNSNGYYGGYMCIDHSIDYKTVPVLEKDVWEVE